MIQQSKIEVLDTNEIDFISGGTLCFLWWCPRLEMADSDPVEPIAPVTELQL